MNYSRPFFLNREKTGLETGFSFASKQWGCWRLSASLVGVGWRGGRNIGVCPWVSWLGGGWGRWRRWWRWRLGRWGCLTWGCWRGQRRRTQWLLSLVLMNLVQRAFRTRVVMVSPHPSSGPGHATSVSGTRRSGSRSFVSGTMHGMSDPKIEHCWLVMEGAFFLSFVL